MTLLGTLLRNSRPQERHHAWNHPRLAAPDTVELTSHDFADDQPLDSRHAGTSVGGQNVSPHLAWRNAPGATIEFLLVVEDLDSPIGSKPPVHCMALIDPYVLRTPNEVPQGGLGEESLATGVTPLRPTFGRGWIGPRPLKGHGTHRYVFQLYALGDSILNRSDRAAILHARPRAFFDSFGSRVLARGRMTGTYER